jgi:peroxiredoxin
MLIFGETVFRYEEGRMFTQRKDIAVPEVGADAPEFNLPSAQGGQLRLSMRTAHGPVVVVFFRGVWSEEDVAYFKALSDKEDEINRARASVVGIGLVEPDEAREFVRISGIKSYVLYDYVRVTTLQWGLQEKDKEHGRYARPAVFIVDSDRKVVQAWTDGRPPVEEILAKVTDITGLPKPAEEEAGEKPEEAGPGGDEKPKKMSAEERERIKAERRAAREAGKSVKSGQQEQTAASEKAPEEAPEEGEKPKKMSAEERERIKAERRAAREAGKSLKTGKPEQSKAAPEDKPESRTEEEPEAGESDPQEATGEGTESGEQPAEAQDGSEREKPKEKPREEE